MLLTGWHGSERISVRMLALKPRLFHESGASTRLFRRRPDLLPKDKDGNPMTGLLRRGSTYKAERNYAKRNRAEYYRDLRECGNSRHQAWRRAQLYYKELTQ